MFSELLISWHLLRVEEDEVREDAPLGDGGQVLPQLRAGGLGVGDASVDRPRRLGHRGLGGPLLNQSEYEDEVVRLDAVSVCDRLSPPRGARDDAPVAA